MGNGEGDERLVVQEGSTLVISVTSLISVATAFRTIGEFKYA
jgi:hypothetical protein